MKIFISVLQALLLFGVITAVTVPYYVHAAEPQKTEIKAEKKPIKEKTSFRRPRMSVEDMQTILYEKYRILNKEEIKSYLDDGVSFRDLDRACLYAYITKKPVGEILKIKKELPWTRVQFKLGLSAQKFHALNTQYKADMTNRWWGFDKARSYKAMMQGYPWHWVKIAWILAEHSDYTMEQILSGRKYTESWIQWSEKNLGINAETYNQWIAKYKNPSYLEPKHFKNK